MDEARITWSAARKNAGITQQEASHALGITPQTLSSYENYATFPEAPMVAKMCELYQRSPNLIFLTKDAT